MSRKLRTAESSTPCMRCKNYCFGYNSKFDNCYARKLDNWFWWWFSYKKYLFKGTTTRACKDYQAKGK